MNEAVMFLAVGGVLAVSIVIAMVASRLGVPSLVGFLVIGMLLGSEGLGRVAFDNAETARMVGTIGLAAILFEGGLSTSWRRLREVAIPAIALSTIGTLLTAILTGVAAHSLFHLPWHYSLLLGAVVSSTDAAAIFATFRFTRIRRRLARTLEAESGVNDPMAIALTVGFIEWIQHPDFGLGGMAALLVHQIGLGLLAGLVLGAASMWAFARLPRSVGSFAPVASIAACALTFGVAGIIGGSGFLAVYIVGLAIGSTPSRYRSQLTVFHEGLAFLAQVAMFIILGLFVFPHHLVPVAAAGIVLALLLVLVIRPVAVWLATPFMRFSPKEKAFLGYAGLRGAVPIVLGTFVLSAHINHAATIFNAVFFIVLASTLIQGTTLERVAKRLGVVDDMPASHPSRQHPNRPERIKFYVTAQHAIAGVMVKEIGLPNWARVTKISRGTEHITPQNDTVIRPDDELLVVAPLSMHPELEDVFIRWRRRV
jgi:cell volume regulation protein A